MSNQIYVGRIRNIPNKEVVDFFSQYGTVTRAFFPRQRIPGKATSYRRPFGFITFENEEQAKAALAANGSKIRENDISVEAAVPRQPRQRNERTRNPAARQAPQAADKPKQAAQPRYEHVMVEVPNAIVVEDVALDTCIRQLLDLFEGPIRYASVTRSYGGKVPSALIKFHSEEDAKKALEKGTVKVGDKDCKVSVSTVRKIKRDKQ